MAEERDNTGLVAPPDAEDILRTDAERRRKLEADLARMGMSPDEVRRLMNADAHTAKMDIEPERAAVAMPTQRRIPTLQAAPKPAGCLRVGWGNRKWNPSTTSPWWNSSGR